MRALDGTEWEKVSITTKMSIRETMGGMRDTFTPCPLNTLLGMKMIPNFLLTAFPTLIQTYKMTSLELRKTYQLKTIFIVAL